MTKISKDGNKYVMHLEVFFEQDGDYCVAYCPSLELSAYAKSESAASKKFSEVLKIFMDDTAQKGSLEKVLLGLGWNLQQKPSFKYQQSIPPLRMRSLRSRADKIEKRSVPIRSTLLAV